MFRGPEWGTFCVLAATFSHWKWRQTAQDSLHCRHSKVFRNHLRGNDLRKQWRIWKPFARNYLSCLQKISSNGMDLRTTYSGFWPCIWKFSLINFALTTTELVLFSRFKISLVTSTTNSTNSRKRRCRQTEKRFN